MSKTIAAIDIGSQTIRLLVASLNADGGLLPVYRDRAIARLGEGMQGTQSLQPEPMRKAVSCIKNFVHAARSRGAVRILPVCTECVRAAKNSADFLHWVQRETGMVPRIVTGDEEALLSFKGVASVLPVHEGSALVIDIGGGSTEIVLMSHGSMVGTASMKIGVISLAEKHLRHDPPDGTELAAMDRDIAKLLYAEPLLRFVPHGQTLLAGTAGTATTLAAMDLLMQEYAPDAVNGHILTFPAVERLFRTLTTLPLAQRQELPGLEPGRAVVMIPGAAAVRAVMQMTGADRMLISDAGLLEGIILDAVG